MNRRRMPVGSESTQEWETLPSGRGVPVSATARAMYALQSLARDEMPSGWAAISLAQEMGLSLSKYADPIEGARCGLTMAEAEEIAMVNPSLIYLEI